MRAVLTGNKTIEFLPLRRQPCVAAGGLVLHQGPGHLNTGALESHVEGVNQEPLS